MDMISLNIFLYFSIAFLVASNDVADDNALLQVVGGDLSADLSFPNFLSDLADVELCCCDAGQLMNMRTRTKQFCLGEIRDRATHTSLLTTLQQKVMSGVGDEVCMGISISSGSEGNNITYEDFKSICGLECAPAAVVTKPGCDVDKDAQTITCSAEATPNRNVPNNPNLDWTDGTRDGVYNNVANRGNARAVYVADTGVNCWHQEFYSQTDGRRCIKIYDEYYPTKGKKRGPICNINSRRCAYDKDGHGTHCAGTVGGKDSGIADRVDIGAVKILSDGGFGSDAGIIAGMDQAVIDCTTFYNSQCVISMSLGGPRGQSDNAWVTAVNSALTNGVITVVAAGNENSDACNFSPSFVPNAVTVGSVQDTGSTSRVTRSSFSNYGPCIDIWAVGSAVRSARHSGKTGTISFSGTSMACPAVAGAMAIVLNRGYQGSAAIQYAVDQAQLNMIDSIPPTPSPTPNKFMRLCVNGHVGSPNAPNCPNR